MRHARNLVHGTEKVNGREWGEMSWQGQSSINFVPERTEKEIQQEHSGSPAHKEV